MFCCFTFSAVRHDLVLITRFLIVTDNGSRSLTHKLVASLVSNRSNNKTEFTILIRLVILSCTPILTVTMRICYLRPWLYMARL